MSDIDYLALWFTVGVGIGVYIGYLFFCNNEIGYAGTDLMDGEECVVISKKHYKRLYSKKH